MKLVRWSVSLLLVMLVAVFAVSYITVGARSSMVVQISTVNTATQRPEHLTVASLNIAHGRADGTSQLLQSTQTIRTNLTAVANLLLLVKADVVALQEVDNRAFWSGNEDQTAFLSQRMSMQNTLAGQHVEGLGLSYGTSLLSHLSLQHPYSQRFAPSYPTLTKGFVVASIQWPNTQTDVDIVSLHLDFFRQSVRVSQIAELIAVLQARNRPVVILGDFNTTGAMPNSALQKLKTALKLSAYAADRQDLPSFPLTGERLDWVLVSESIQFTAYATRPEIVSDHLAVVAELRLLQDI